MVLTLIKGCLVIDTWQEPGFSFECEDKFGQHFLNAGVAIPYELAQQQGIESTEHPGHGHSEKAVHKRQRES